MKPPVFRPVPGASLRLCGLSVVLLMAVCFSSASLRAEETPPPNSPAASPDASGSPAKEKHVKGAPKPPKAAKPPKDVPIPMPVGEPAFGLKIPESDTAGRILSLLQSSKATLIDATHLQMEGANLDLNKADGKSDYHIQIPTSVLDLKTHIITSEAAVVIKTADFELTGEKMRFDTVERSGEFIGKVRMVIRNLKQSASIAPQQLSKTE